ncbi:DUF5711 family protein [Lacrimispora sp. NSJ-141]|uniref:DUF5711 family protein n=1 Tax=Lientehia hominis TaxID=2897778 RepID=A0AAP2RKT5_9FIRM|nr:DUF5711 family protein [Lientehia hominis]MCD2493353.1 DUF5711 family protein [Lientehia hominis]
MENKRDREKRKRQLREGIIDSENLEQDEDLREDIKKHRQFRVVITVLLIVVIAAGLFGYHYYQTHHQYQKFSAKWEKELSEGSFSGYEAYGENVVKYTRDGASYIDRRGEELWNQAFEMKSPFARTSGDYVAIADKNGYSIYICDKSGCQGVVTTTLPISKVAVSSTGVTVAILEDSKSNFIAFYDKSGTKLKIEVQTTLAGNGYPIDLSISPNGMLLMVSYVYLDQGIMQNQVVFYNFDEEGQNVKDRLVGGFKEYGSNMVAKVQFLDDRYACAFAQDRLCFYSLENTVKPELLQQVDVEGEISSIFYSDKYAGMIVKNENGDKELMVYGSSGRLVFRKDVDMEYETAEISGNHVLLYREAECSIYNMSGILKYHGTLDGSIEKLICLGDNKYIQIGPRFMKELELQ